MVKTTPTAVIPAAGVGTRLRPHTHTVPKALVPVAGKPMLAHIIDELAALGIGELVLVVGHMGEPIRRFVDASYPELAVEYVEQEERQGLGHAVYLTREVIDPQRPLLIVLGDTIFRANFQQVVTSPKSLIGVREVEDPRRFGIVELGAEGEVARLVEKPEKPTSNLAIVGIYHIVETSVLMGALGELIAAGQRTRGEFQLTDGLQAMVASGVPMGVFAVDEWFDCGQPETLLATNRRLLELAAAEPPAPRPGVLFVPPVAVAPTAQVQNAIVGPHVTVGARAVVQSAIVRNTIINESAIVEHALLDASVVGDHAVVKGSFRRLNVGDSSEVEVI